MSFISSPELLTRGWLSSRYHKTKSQAKKITGNNTDCIIWSDFTWFCIQNAIGKDEIIQCNSNAWHRNTALLFSESKKIFCPK